MTSKVLTYEQPLNERIRSFLRLEFLFDQADYFLRGAASWSSHACLAGILEIQNLLARNDVKTEVLKELERHTSNLARLEQNPGVDRQRLAEVLDELDSLIDRLYSNSQPLGQELKQNDFLNSVRQRLSIPGGTCDFDLPGLHHWLQSPNEQRIRDLGRWLAAYDVLHQAITLMLHLVRESSSLRQEVAADGFYQKSLDPNNACQMLRISIPAGCGYYPEVSGGKHRFSIRFMQQSSPDEKPVQVHQDVPFQLACCVI